MCGRIVKLVVTCTVFIPMLISAVRHKEEDLKVKHADPEGGVPTELAAGQDDSFRSQFAERREVLRLSSWFRKHLPLQIKLAIFDKDGTIITSELWLQTCIAKAFEEKGGKVIYTMDDHKELVSMSEGHSFDENLLRFAVDSQCPEVMQLGVGMLSDGSWVHKEDGIAWINDVRKPLYRRYQVAPRLLELLQPTPGAQRLVQYIKNKLRVPVAINSSGKKVTLAQNKNTRAVKVLDMFEDANVLLADTYGNKEETEARLGKALEKKPAPDTYLHVATHMMNLTLDDLEEVIVFEDTPKGALAAVRANVGTVVVTTNGEMEDVRSRFIRYKDASGNRFEPSVEDLERNGALVFVSSLHVAAVALEKSRSSYV